MTSPTTSSRRATPAAATRPPMATRPPDDRPPARTWWPERVARPPALPGEVYQPALFPATSEPRRPPPVVRVPHTGQGGLVRVSRISALPDRRLPDVRRWAVTLGVAVLESLAGYRVLAQLVRYVSEEVQAAIQLAALPATSRARDRIVLASVRIQVLSEGSVEVCLHALQGDRRILLAFRLTAETDKWFCTDLDVLCGSVTIRSGSR